MKLGAEIGRSENRHVRHRMFAIVDRTNLRVPFRTIQGPPTPPVTTPPATKMLVDVGPNQELVTVTATDPVGLTFTASFQFSHPPGFLINLYAMPGNPGPPPPLRYDPRQDVPVVRYFGIIH